MIRQLLYIVTGVVFYGIARDHVHAASLCPEQGWYNADSNICYWMTTVKAGAVDTNGYCGLGDGQLAVFFDQSSLNWVISNLGTNIISLTSLFWIGMTDSNSEGTFTSFGGQTTWASWSTGNPTGVPGKDCVIIDTEDSWKMFDEFCNTPYFGLCSTVLEYCPTGSYYLPSNLLCYWITPLPAQDADTNNLLCNADNGSLAVIPDAQVDAQFDIPPLSNLLTGLTEIYIGVHDKTVEGVEYTYEGVPVTWTNWLPGEPNDPNFPSFPAQDCVTIVISGNRKWKDIECTIKKQALCYRNLASFSVAPIVYPTTTTAMPTTTTTTTTTVPTTTTVTTTTVATTIKDMSTEGEQTTTTTESTGNILTTEIVTTQQPEESTTVNEQTTTADAMTTVHTSQDDTTTPTEKLTTDSSATAAVVTSGSNDVTTDSGSGSVTSGSTGDQSSCLCPCENQRTFEEMQKQIEEMKKELTIDYKTTSAYIRTKKSIYEDRPVAQNLGIVGITILCLVFGSIFLLDVGTFLKQIKNCFRTRTWKV